MIDNIEKLKKTLEPFTKEVFFVGGYVRDKILGKESKDIDIEVFGLSQEKLEEILLNIKGEELNMVGKSFGIYKIGNIDISIPRTENCIGKGHKDFKVDLKPNLSIKEAQRRRDLTINAIYENIFTGEIVDNFNGIEALKEGRISFVDKETFKEDPLRLFRVAQFSSRFSFFIDKEIEEISSFIDISSLPTERIFEETNKALLKSKKPSLYFSNLLKLISLKEYKRIYKIDFIPKNLDYFIENIKELKDREKLKLLYFLIYQDLKELPEFLPNYIKNFILKVKTEKEVFRLSFKEETFLDYFKIFGKEKFKEERKRFLEFKKNKLSGEELKERFNLKEGKELGELLKFCENLTLEGKKREEILEIISLLYKNIN